MVPGSSKKAPTSFLDLPAEVRNSVYCLVFAEVRLFISTSDKSRAECIFEDRNIALLKADDRIEKEAAGYMYQNLSIETEWSLLPETRCFQRLPNKQHLLEAFQCAKTIILVGFLEPDGYDPGTFAKCYGLQNLVIHIAMSKDYPFAANRWAAKNQLRREGDGVIETYLNDCRVRLERDYGMNGRIHGAEREWCGEFDDFQPGGRVRYVRKSRQRLYTAPLGSEDLESVHNKTADGAPSKHLSRITLEFE